MDQISVSPKWSLFGSKATTIRHAVYGFLAVGGAKVAAILVPALTALESGDYSQVVALNPKALLGAFVSGAVGAAIAGGLRLFHVFSTEQKVVR